ncbi:isocitrate lyase/phosphoenolpyruvate mutase family protein [Solihabitans fulvus]|uniref:Isocitrate lyase/phosphoenolpyruvate mutase family protein n=1 Tax=Solihabitans fulvus TaxID=1892852 RepID=A0A5B2WSV0_9PSEU|nr:isocitrate lyase/phosphoenolpyruvate mutase family protein [Solihabitans fulvus]KAA2253964.1 isocitrate lyase/phosphoenolpyruvate mutase family protein [Solihabitans fulvus]
MSDAERFAGLHVPGAPLVLPNAWDHASAAALAAHGFAAVGTTSLGVAAASGKPDGTGATRAETLALAHGITALPCLVTVDVEGGFSDDPARVADLAAELAGYGVVGINLEDGRADGSLVPAGRHARVIAAIRDRVPGLFVNARTDTYWLRAAEQESVAETLRRARVYVEAGADGVFVPGLPDDAAIAAVAESVRAPLNVLYAPGRHSRARLAELGVARISTGSLLFRAALHAVVSVAAELSDAVPDAEPTIPTYQRVQDIMATVDTGRAR